LAITIFLGGLEVKPEYHKGAGARKNFEDTMQKLFRAPKPPKEEKPPKKAASRAKKVSGK
jgi:hypothetical protein